MVCGCGMFITLQLLCVWISPTWTGLLRGTKLLSLNLWPFQCSKWSGWLVPLFCWSECLSPCLLWLGYGAPVDPENGFPPVLYMICERICGRSAVMSVGLQISFWLNLIFARCFSFLCDGWDYRCSWWRFAPVQAVLPHTSSSLHTILPEWSSLLTSVC